MMRFTALSARLECANSEVQRIDALRDYLAGAPPGDAAWAVALLAGRGLGRLLRAEPLCESAVRAARVERWLFDTCLEASGDIAETIAHLLPPARRAESNSLASWIDDRLLSLPECSVPTACERALQWCDLLDPAGRELLVRLMLGRWRAMVDESLLLQALAQHAGIDIRLLRLRWPEWTNPRLRPDASRLAAVLRPQPTPAEERAQAYPFAALQTVAASATSSAELEGGAAAWLVRTRHGNCRLQLVRRAEGAWLWSSSGELLNRRCADILAAAAELPVDTVLEGELVGTGLVVVDLLELGSLNLRDRPYVERMARACDLPLVHPIALAPEIGIEGGTSPVPLLARCRSRGVHGLLLLRRDAHYGAAQALMHLLPPPMRAIAAVRTAQSVVDSDGAVRLELGLAVWDQRPHDEAGLAAALRSMATGARLGVGQQLVPLAKLRLDPPAPGDAADLHADGLLGWIQEATMQRFGPVRLLRPGRLCEIEFDDLEPSARRKSGFRLTGVRLQRWRSDCSLMDVDDVQRMRGLLAPEVSTGATP